jgi:hypothetical protein
MAAIGVADTIPVAADHGHRATGTIMTGANEVPTRAIPTVSAWRAS